MYLKSLKSKNVIITGCNKGIGRATLEGFAKYGANIFACVRSDSKEFKKFTSSLKKKYKVKIYIIKLDLLKSLIQPQEKQSLTLFLQMKYFQKKTS